MSTVVCQTIQSCFEPRSLSLKLNPSNLQIPECLEETNGWGSIQSTLSNACSDKAEVYVHPLVKQSTSMLSDKSLEMCTESLGSETGTDVTEDDIFSIMSLDSRAVRERRRRKAVVMEDRRGGYESLPPPLTILRGASSIRVQPHRENGRLVMTAVCTSPRRSSIHAERCNGRLTMSMSLDEAKTECGECSEGEREEGHGEQQGDGLNIGEVGDEEEEEDHRDGTNLVGGGKFGRGEIQRPSRCNESERGTGRRLIKWDTFWVAT